jgi:hypothetical protein
MFPLLAVAQHHQSNSADKISTHGMLIFGKEKFYASHLPLFHPPHHYQIILELEIDKTSRQKFITDQQLHPESVTYTIEPEKFILPEKINSKGNFKAKLYRGHFERGGIKIADDVRIKITQVIYFKMLGTATAKDTNTDFILFGNSKEQFAVHHISNKPDFEQIIQVKTTPIAGDYLLLSFKKDSNSPVGVSGNAIETADKRKIILLKQLYIEFEDLKE